MAITPEMKEEPKYSKLIMDSTWQEKENLNIQEMRGLIIDRLLLVEGHVDSQIEDFFKPQNKNVFRKIFLNNSILSFGGKLRILKNISGLENKVFDKLMKLSSIRNGFAHASINEHVNINVQNFDSKGHKKTAEIVDVEVVSMIEVMKSNGLIDCKIAIDYWKEFNRLYIEIMEEFQ